MHPFESYGLKFDFTRPFEGRDGQKEKENPTNHHTGTRSE